MCLQSAPTSATGTRVINQDTTKVDGSWCAGLTKAGRKISAFPCSVWAVISNLLRRIFPKKSPDANLNNRTVFPSTGNTAFERCLKDIVKIEKDGVDRITSLYEKSLELHKKAQNLAKIEQNLAENLRKFEEAQVGARKDTADASTGTYSGNFPSRSAPSVISINAGSDILGGSNLALTGGELALLPSSDTIMPSLAITAPPAFSQAMNLGKVMDDSSRSTIDDIYKELLKPSGVQAGGRKGSTNSSTVTYSSNFPSSIVSSVSSTTSESDIGDVGNNLALIGEAMALCDSSDTTMINAHSRPQLPFGDADLKAGRNGLRNSDRNSSTAPVQRTSQVSTTFADTTQQQQQAVRSVVEREAAEFVKRYPEIFSDVNTAIAALVEVSKLSAQEIETYRSWNNDIGGLVPFILTNSNTWPENLCLQVNATVVEKVDGRDVTRIRTSYLAKDLENPSIPKTGAEVIVLELKNNHFSPIVNGVKEEVRGDGNCFYHSILFAMSENHKQELLGSHYVPGNDEEAMETNIMLIRSMCGEIIRARMDIYGAQLLENILTTDLKTVIDQHGEKLSEFKSHLDNLVYGS